MRNKTLNNKEIKMLTGGGVYAILYVSQWEPGEVGLLECERVRL